MDRRTMTGIWMLVLSLAAGGPCQVPGQPTTDGQWIFPTGAEAGIMEGDMISLAGDVEYQWTSTMCLSSSTPQETLGTHFGVLEDDDPALYPLLTVQGTWRINPLGDRSYKGQIFRTLEPGDTPVQVGNLQGCLLEDSQTAGPIVGSWKINESGQTTAPADSAH